MEQTKSAKPSALGLRSVSLLAGVEREALEALAQQCRWRRFTHGQRGRIRGKHRTGDVYLIIAGRVRVTAFSTGAVQVD